MRFEEEGKRMGASECARTLFVCPHSLAFPQTS